MIILAPSAHPITSGRCRDIIWMFARVKTMTCDTVRAAEISGLISEAKCFPPTKILEKNLQNLSYTFWRIIRRHVIMRETASYPAARYVRGENIGENNGYIILQPDSPDINNPIFRAVLILRRQTS